MKRLTFAVLIVAVLWFGVGFVRRALASPEQHIRWRIEHMLEAVDDGHPARIMLGFDRERYVDEGTGFDAPKLRDALLYLFLQERVKLSAELDPEDGLRIEVDEAAEPPRARVQFHCRLDELLPSGERRLWWDLSGVGDMERREGAWRFVRSRDVVQDARWR